MNLRIILSFVALLILCILSSCAHVSKRMPGELKQMHEFLTQDDPSKCKNYHYNFERQAPRLYSIQRADSILDVIDYIKSECGPSANLEVTRLLLLTDQGHFDDSLIGFATIPQMLWHRSEQEYIRGWRNWSYLYGSKQPTDNTHDNFEQFQENLAQKVSSKSDVQPTGQTLGLYYGGEFDSAFSLIQSDELKGTAIQRSYNRYINRTKMMYPSRGHMSILMGSWIPQGNNKLLGNHPDLGFQIGGEGKLWRADFVFGFRFVQSKSNYLIDSLGQIVSTKEFSSTYLGAEIGLKFIDNSTISTDIFVGLGYDHLNSVKKINDPEEYVHHGSFTANIGLRQRIFIDKRKGWYIGGIVRYGLVDYNNPGGTDLSGNTLTISLVTGWSFHETLDQFFRKLNYKGDWRK
ncbi:MAG: porin family protein [candidate division Zixibacteria bacterium]|nr:porin family protein [candidate division Zixibacteria bacterium]